MTDTEASVETVAQRIAARGRDALVERLRSAYADAAAAHADIVTLDSTRIEALVQSAADRADGLQWRRALAGVAAAELGVSVPEALSHPAVVRAQALVGAPSYEQSLAELIARPVPPATTEENGHLPPTMAYAVVPDAGMPDTGTPDTEVSDAGASEAAAPDAGVFEAGESEAAAPDTGVFEAGGSDTGESEAGGSEAGGSEAAAPEAGVFEAGGSDTGESDAAAPETGASGVPDATAPDTSASEIGASEIGAPDTGVSDVPDAGMPYTWMPAAGVPEAATSVPEPQPGPEPTPEPEPTPDPEPAPGPDLTAGDPLPNTDALTNAGAAAGTGAVTEPEPFSNQPEPSSNQPELFSNQPEPLSNHSEPSSEEPQPLSNHSEPLSNELEPVQADNEVFDLLPEPEPIEADTQLHEVAPAYLEDAPPPKPQPERLAPTPGVPEDLRVNAIHLGGVANLPTKREGLDLQLSVHGLDILQSNEEILGRLIWDEIDSLEVPHFRSRRRRQQVRARLIVRTPHGDASFEIPGFTGEELRDRIEPLVSLYGRR